MMKPFNSVSTVLLALSAVACASTSLSPAPVIERSVNAAAKPVSAAPTPRPPVVTAPQSIQAAPVLVQALPQAAAQAQVPAPAPTAPGNYAVPKSIFINDGKNYVVKKGDTLYGIALENGLSYRDLADWNGVTNPAYIQVDQVLRLIAPEGAVPASGSAVQALPIDLSGSATGTTTTTVVAPAAAPTVVAAPAQVTQPAVTAAAPSAAPAAVSSDGAWQWPNSGKVLQGFVEGKSKGIDIAGKMGDPIVAAGDGKIVYAGAALKGYGQLIIIKHNEVYLTAYAHNSKLLVKENVDVKRGQKIAEMGNTESDNGVVKLHFELRRSGKPVDPSKTLPAQ